MLIIVINDLESNWHFICHGIDRIITEELNDKKWYMYKLIFVKKTKLT